MSDHKHEHGQCCCHRHDHSCLCSHDADVHNHDCACSCGHDHGNDETAKKELPRLLVSLVLFAMGIPI